MKFISTNDARKRLSARLLVCFAVCCLAMAGCVTAPPLNADAVTVKLTPDQVKAEPDSAKGTVIWGGVIISTVNLADRTQIEVLAYPLNRNQRPSISKQPLGRFLLQSPEYIEATQYSEGRELTAIGMLQGITKGEVGEADYDFPTVTLSDVYLWHRDNSHEKPRFIFGIGLNL